MPYLTKKVGFAAAHHYWNPEFSEAENREAFGVYANSEGHGHFYQLEVTLKGPIHPDTGMIINYADLDPILERCILKELDFKNLNTQVPGFKDRISTPENLVLFLWERLSPAIAETGLALYHLKLTDNNALHVEYDGATSLMPILTRRYTFSAAHRLWNPDFSDAENQRHFGPCVNIHGHNYTMEVSIQGPLHPETAMIMDLKRLDEVVNRLILGDVDHRYLDQDVAFLNDTLSTVENLAQLFCKRLAPEIKPPAKLARMRLFESETNWTEVDCQDWEASDVRSA